jgi:hypothetical protein
VKVRVERRKFGARWVKLESEIGGSHENSPYQRFCFPSSLLVQLSHHNLRGHYHHSGPEEAFESAVHSVNRPSHLQIVWLEYLTYLRGNVVKRKKQSNCLPGLLGLCLQVFGCHGYQASPTHLITRSTNKLSRLFLSRTGMQAVLQYPASWIKIHSHLSQETGP